MEESSTSAFDRLKHPRFIYDTLVRRQNGDSNATPSSGSVPIYKDQYNYLMGLIKANDTLYHYVARHIKYKFASRYRRIYYHIPGQVHNFFVDHLLTLIDARIAAVKNEDCDFANNIASAISQARVVENPDVAIDGLWEFNWGPEENKACFALDVVYSHNYNIAEANMEKLLLRTEGRPASGIIICVSNDRMKLDIPAAAGNKKKRAFYAVLRFAQDSSEKKPYVTKEHTMETEFRKPSGMHGGGALRITVRDFIGPNHVRSLDETDPATMNMLEEEIVIYHDEINRCLMKAERAPVQRLASANRDAQTGADSLPVAALSIDDSSAHFPSSDSGPPAS